MEILLLVLAATLVISFLIVVPVYGFCLLVWALWVAFLSPEAAKKR